MRSEKLKIDDMADEECSSADGLDSGTNGDFGHTYWRAASSVEGTLDVLSPHHLDDVTFRLLADNLPTLCWIANGDGFIVWYNRRWHTYCGTTATEMEGWGWTKVHDPERLPSVMERWVADIENGQPFEMTFPLKGADGRFRPFLTRIQPVRDASGRVARWFGVNTEIGAQVAAEQALIAERDANRAMLEAQVEERTRERDRLWDLSEDLLVVADYDDRLLRVSPSWTSVLGHDEGALLTRPYKDFVHPADLTVVTSAFRTMRASGRAISFENRLRAADGSWRWVAWTLSPEPGGERLTGVGRDMTRDKEKHAKLEEAHEQLRHAQKMEAVGQLTGGVAHDFNNLLTVIRSSADLLRRPDLAEERRRRYVDAIADTVDRAAKLTSQLLAFARRQTLKPEVFDVCVGLRAIIEMLGTVVGSRIRIAIDTTNDPCPIEADANQFETALVNIVVNARDAMDGVGVITITVEKATSLPPIRGHAGALGDFVSIAVRDTGSGIPADKVGQIFEPFFTTKEVGKGTGLGLSQVYGFTKQSGGDVAVESEVGTGTTFTLYLPRTSRAPLAAKPALEGPPADGGGGKRVLVVEDNFEVGTFTTQILQDLGYETVWTANASEALAQLEVDARAFDVVFSDVVMPGMSGIELGHAIRSAYPSLPVVLTSGYSHVLAEEGLHGFEIVRKPYAMEELSRVLDNVIHARRVTTAG